MPSVTIDLEDLETLVFTTGALKTIEGALAQRKRDPFVQQHLDFTAAHDRLASAMRNARRAEAGTLVAWDGALEMDEVQMLRELDEYEGAWKEYIFNTKSLIDKMQAKGMAVAGQIISGVVWPGQAQPEIHLALGRGLAVKITDRGREKLALATTRAKIEAQKEKASG